MLELKKPVSAEKLPKTKQQFIRAAKVDAPMKKALPFNGGPQTKEWLNAISIKMRKTVSHAVEDLVERVHGDVNLQKRIQDFQIKYPAEPPMKQVNLLVPLATHRQLEDLHYGGSARHGRVPAADFVYLAGWKSWTLKGNQTASVPLYGSGGLQAQLGSMEYKRDRRFREKVMDWLGEVKAWWPQCPAQMSGPRYPGAVGT